MDLKRESMWAILPYLWCAKSFFTQREGHFLTRYGGQNHIFGYQLCGPHDVNSALSEIETPVQMNKNKPLIKSIGQIAMELSRIEKCYMTYHPGLP